MFMIAMDIMPPMHPAKQSRRSYQSLTNVYVPLVWFDMSQRDAGSCDRP